jgi:hypothetical protein
MSWRRFGPAPSVLQTRVMATPIADGSLTHISDVACELNVRR